jgi:hypothetical protein
VLVLLAMLAFVVGTTFMNWVKYVSLRSNWPFDLATFNNEAFNYAVGRDVTYLWPPQWFVPDFEGPSVFRTVHFTPLRTIVLYQFSWVWPHVVTLMVLQSLLIAVGAVGLYRLVCERLARPGVGLLVAGSYLAHPAILHLAFSDYREGALGVGPALLALWLHARGRLAAFVVAALFMLAARPEYLFLLAAFGIMNAGLRPSRIRGWLWAGLPVGLAVLWFGLTKCYYLYAYDGPWPSLQRVSNLSPLATLAQVADRVPPFARTMLLPAVVGLGTPEAALWALPFVAHAGSVQWPGFPHQDLHHLAPGMVAVFWAFAATIVRWWWLLAGTARRWAWARAVLLAALVASLGQFAWGVASAYLVGGIPRYPELAHLSDSLPPDATVLVPHALVARFSHHTRVLADQWIPTPNRFRSEQERRETLAAIAASADLVVTRRNPRVEEAVTQSGRFLPPREISGFRVFLLRADAPRPPDPDRSLQRGLRWYELKPHQRRWATLHVDD